MACGHVGDGRLAEPWDIVRAAARLLAPRDLIGKRILITAGPTREALDPVRFISNPSSGKMGYALASVAALRGAEVTLISGPVTIAPPVGVKLLRVVTAEEMSRAVDQEADRADAIIMAAAVSDYRPASVSPQKVKKKEGPEVLTFVRTQDILAGLGERFAVAQRRPIIVGFAAETENVVDNAREKLLRKRCDFIVANYVGEGGAFGATENEVTLVSPDAARVLPRGLKETVASGILDEIAHRWRVTRSA
jgi:phosphopantothenoylcysteine decarboxylase/phosphopantothenate--cysteine ligase